MISWCLACTCLKAECSCSMSLCLAAVTCVSACKTFGMLPIYWPCGCLFVLLVWGCFLQLVLSSSLNATAYTDILDNSAYTFWQQLGKSWFNTPPCTKPAKNSLCVNELDRPVQSSDLSAFMPTLQLLICCSSVWLRPSLLPSAAI